MTLDQLEIGETGYVDVVGGNGALRQHFLDMGLIPGAEVTIVKYAPMGDPIEMRIHGYELTLRRDDAKNITVHKVKKTDHIHNNGEEFHEHPGLGEDGVRYHDRKQEHPLPEGTTLTFALAGNQNAGKTTLFNQLTGSNQHVGNFPGVTVDQKSGVIKNHSETQVVDLPGIYSLSRRTRKRVLNHPIWHQRMWSSETVLRPGYSVKHRLSALSQREAKGQGGFSSVTGGTRPGMLARGIPFILRVGIEAMSPCV